jgi:adenylate cyclase
LAWRLHFHGAGNEKQHVEAFMLEQKLIPFRRPLVDGNKAMKESVFQKENELHRMYRLKRYFSPQIAEIVLKCPDGDSLWESHRQEVTVVVLVLRGFTRFANNAEPEEVMALLRNYHAEMGRLVFKFDGTLERFTGDGMMVFFNDTVACEQQTKKAVTMALEMRDRGKELRTGWRAKGYDLDLGIGLAAGYATVGNFGFEGRMDYGVVGKVTNLTYRLCEEANGGQILTNRNTLSKIEDFVHVEPVVQLQLKGFTHPVSAFNIVGTKA